MENTKKKNMLILCFLMVSLVAVSFADNEININDYFSSQRPTEFKLVGYKDSNVTVKLYEVHGTFEQGFSSTNKIYVPLVNTNVSVKFYTSNGNRYPCPNYDNVATDDNGEIVVDTSVCISNFSRIVFTYRGDEYRKPCSLTVTGLQVTNTNNIAQVFGFMMDMLSNTKYNAICFMTVIVIGLLVAAMYYTGDNPFGILDITTPKTPKVFGGKMVGSKIKLSRDFLGRIGLLKKVALASAGVGAATSALSSQAEGVAGARRKTLIRKINEANLSPLQRAYLLKLTMSGKGGLAQAILNGSRPFPTEYSMEEEMRKLNVTDRFKPIYNKQGTRMENKLSEYLQRKEELEALDKAKYIHMVKKIPVIGKVVSSHKKGLRTLGTAMGLTISKVFSVPATIASTFYTKGFYSVSFEDAQPWSRIMKLHDPIATARQMYETKRDDIYRSLQMLGITHIGSLKQSGLISDKTLNKAREIISDPKKSEQDKTHELVRLLNDINFEISKKAKSKKQDVAAVNLTSSISSLINSRYQDVVMADANRKLDPNFTRINAMIWLDKIAKSSIVLTPKDIERIKRLCTQMSNVPKDQYAEELNKLKRKDSLAWSIVNAFGDYSIDYINSLIIMNTFSSNKNDIVPGVKTKTFQDISRDVRDTVARLHYGGFGDVKDLESYKKFLNVLDDDEKRLYVNTAKLTYDKLLLPDEETRKVLEDNGLTKKDTKKILLIRSHLVAGAYNDIFRDIAGAVSPMFYYDAIRQGKITTPVDMMNQMIRNANDWFRESEKEKGIDKMLKDDKKKINEYKRKHKEFTYDDARRMLNERAGFFNDVFLDVYSRFDNSVDQHFLSRIAPAQDIETEYIIMKHYIHHFGNNKDRQVVIDKKKMLLSELFKLELDKAKGNVNKAIDYLIDDYGEQLSKQLFKNKRNPYMFGRKKGVEGMAWIRRSNGEWLPYTDDLHNHIILGPKDKVVNAKLMINDESVVEPGWKEVKSTKLYHVVGKTILGKDLISDKELLRQLIENKKIRIKPVV